MQDGDVIDVRISQPCTRGADPIPAQQTLPKIHYLATPPTSTVAPSPAAPVQVEGQQEGPAAPARISLRIREPNGTKMVLTVRKTIPMRNFMLVFAAQIRKQVKECRFVFEGQRILGDDHSCCCGPERTSSEHACRLGGLVAILRLTVVSMFP